MRRLERSETFHGTRHGQLAVDRAMVERFGLTEREALCASFLKRGLSPRRIADALQISPSTAEKHLGALRRKLNVNTTQEAVVYLLRLEREQEEQGAAIAEGFGAEATVDLAVTSADSRVSHARLREASTLRELVGELVRAGRSDGLRAAFYFALPLSAASFRGGDMIRAHVASAKIELAYHAHRDWVARAIAARLFETPDRVVVVDVEGELSTSDSPPMPEAFATTFREEGVRYGIALGMPFGTGYYAVSALYENATACDFRAGLEARLNHLRGDFRAIQNAAYAFGALAREAGLTIRERDALGLLAEGFSSKQAADRLRISPRAFGQLTRSARTKLRVDSTTAAVAKAMAMNALVFL